MVDNCGNFGDELFVGTGGASCTGGFGLAVTEKQTICLFRGRFRVQASNLGINRDGHVVGRRRHYSLSNIESPRSVLLRTLILLRSSDDLESPNEQLAKSHLNLWS